MADGVYLLHSVTVYIRFAQFVSLFTGFSFQSAKKKQHPTHLTLLSHTSKLATPDCQCAAKTSIAFQWIKHNILAIKQMRPDMHNHVNLAQGSINALKLRDCIVEHFLFFIM